MRVQQYTVAQSRNLATLVLEVNTLLANGWKIAGGIAATTDTPTLHEMYYQALTKDAPDREFNPPSRSA